MFRSKFILLIFIVACAHTVFAQADFADVDSITYRQYLNNQWKPLIKYGKKASKSGLDYYYLNMRIGIAYYNKLQYRKAGGYFKKALKNDSYNDAAKEYLFWSDLFNGDTREADDTYLSLSDSVQQRLKYKVKKPFESVFAEGGAKISTNKQIANTLGYFQVGISHKFTKSFSIYHTYTFQKQKQIGGSYMQHQYYFAPTLKLKKELTLNFAFHFVSYNGTINFEHFLIQPQQPGPGGVRQELHSYRTRNGSYKENLFLLQAGVSKTIKGFTIHPFGAVILNVQNSNFINEVHDTLLVFNAPPGPPTINIHPVINSPVKKKELKVEGLLGVGLFYNFGRISIGADVVAVFIDSVKTAVVVPQLRALVSKHFGLNAFYMYKGSYPLALFDGSQMYNSLDQVKYKASLTGEFYIGKKLTLFLTYQFEKITDSFTLEHQEYHLHTILTGLNLKL